MKKLKKSLGQYILKNPNISKILATSLEDIHNNLVIEIGGGYGHLTRFLVKAKQLIVYEIDKNLVKFLKNKFKNYRNIKIHHADFLKTNLKKFNHNFYIIGNIPYFITGKIIRKIFNFNNYPKIAVITLAKEYGDKILGVNGNNFLHCWLNNFAQIKKILVIKKNNFYPLPQVDSMALKFYFYEKPIISNQQFEIFLKNLFKFNNRTLYNNLKLAYGKRLFLIDKKLLLKRPHQLSFKEILEIFNLIYLK
jgi:16S rRNA (adenine1518-N6/adenine1519-N6)-dimethyltransferase